MFDASAQLLTGLFEASSFVDLSRLPELFCGFRRRPGEGPTRYPVACAPQTSASGCSRRVSVSRGGAAGPGACWPILPAAIDEVRLQPGRRTPHLSAVS